MGVSMFVLCVFFLAAVVAAVQHAMQRHTQHPARSPPARRCDWTSTGETAAAAPATPHAPASSLDPIRALRFDSIGSSQKASRTYHPAAWVGT